MALETFSPSIAPSPGTGFTPVIKLREADFGDGYSQSSPDGLNHIKMKVELSWRGLTAAQLSELRSFFEGKLGSTPFYYKPRSFDTALKWVCKEWSFSDDTPWTFRASLVQSFTPEI